MKMQGVVVRVNDAKTVKVEVTRRWQHPVYKKFVKRTKQYLCGVVDGMTVAVGEEVVLQACRPLSKLKRFQVVAKGVQEA